MSTGSGGTAGQGATAKECAETISAKQLIGVGFADVTNARRWLGFPELDAVDLPRLLEGLAHAASPDVALQLIVRLIEQHPEVARRVTGDPADSETMFRLLGASEALGEFLLRAPENLDLLDIRPRTSRAQSSRTHCAESCSGPWARIRTRGHPWPP